MTNDLKKELLFFKILIYPFSLGYCFGFYSFKGFLFCLLFCFIYDVFTFFIDKLLFPFFKWFFKKFFDFDIEEQNE